tara:strand:+ start:41 stop:868 length:828 start_codon:yes stop_codon:yes gene_type:complete
MLLESYIKLILLSESNSFKEDRVLFVDKLTEEFKKLIESYTEFGMGDSYSNADWEVTWERLDEDTTSLWENFEEKVNNPEGWEGWIRVFDEAKKDMHGVFKKYCPITKRDTIQFDPYDLLDDWDIENMSKEIANKIYDKYQLSIYNYINKDKNDAFIDANKKWIDRENKSREQSKKSWRTKAHEMDKLSYDEKQKLARDYKNKRDPHHEDFDIHTSFKNLEKSEYFREYIKDEYLSDEAIEEIMDEEENEGIGYDLAKKIAMERALEYMKSLGLA